jgi:hypothetical protein
MKTTAFRNTAPCSLVEVDRIYRGTYCLHYRGNVAVMMEAVNTSVTSVYFYKTTLRSAPQGRLYPVLCYFACKVPQTSANAGLTVASCYLLRHTIPGFTSPCRTCHEVCIRLTSEVPVIPCLLSRIILSNVSCVRTGRAFVR